MFFLTIRTILFSFSPHSSHHHNKKRVSQHLKKALRMILATMERYRVNFSMFSLDTFLNFKLFQDWHKLQKTLPCRVLFLSTFSFSLFTFLFASQDCENSFSGKKKKKKKSSKFFFFISFKFFYSFCFRKKKMNSKIFL